MTATINGQTQTLATVQVQGNVGDGEGMQRDIQHGNGRYHTDYFDTDARLAATTSDKGSGLGLIYDTRNRIENLINFANGQWSQDYGYDDLDQLASITATGVDTEGFAHDLGGNRKNHTVNGAVRNYTVSPTSNRLMAIAGGGLDRTYTYYPTGQVKSITGPLSTLTGEPVTAGAAAPLAKALASEIFHDGFESGGASPTWQFSYDRANRLSAITGPGLDASYTIAATGMRAAKTVNGNTTRFVYGLNGQLLHEHDLHTGHRDQHLYLHGRPIALIRNNAVYWAHTDHLGRPEVLANSSGATVWRAIPQAFTRQVITDTIGGYHVGFPGQYHDEETGFAYNIHRDYDPVTGRYLQSDPIGLAGGMNTYAYVGGNPVSWVDPLGLIFGFDTGECAADEAAQYWADKAMETGNPLYHIPGALAALWTPDASDNTFTVLSLGYGTGGAIGAGVRIEMGAWKQGGEWIAGGPGNKVLHGHFGTGPGMTKHHLPYQAADWVKNFMANLRRGVGAEDAANAAKVTVGVAGAAGSQAGSTSLCGCR